MNTSNEAREQWEASNRQHYTIEKLKDRNDAHSRHHEMPSEYQIEAAINETGYKYFGDYEMSDGQRIAVEVLIEAALAGQRATERYKPLVDAARELSADPSHWGKQAALNQALATLEQAGN